MCSSSKIFGLELHVQTTVKKTAIDYNAQYIHACMYVKPIIIRLSMKANTPWSIIVVW